MIREAKQEDLMEIGKANGDISMEGLFYIYVKVESGEVQKNYGK